jgi:hypothetical protein
MKNMSTVLLILVVAIVIGGSTGALLGMWGVGGSMRIVVLIFTVSAIGAISRWIWLRRVGG